MRRTILLYLTTLCVGGCQEDPVDGHQVVVCGDLSVPEEIDAIRLSVYREDRSEAWSAVVELHGGAASMPVSMTEDAGEAAFPDAGSSTPTEQDPGVNAGWLGGPCEVASECGHGQALCLTASDGYPGGTCTKTCRRNCPNRAETPRVVCIGEVGEPVGLEEGACVQLCDVEALPPEGCRPGYVCTVRPRYDNGNEKNVCLPRSLVEPDAGVPDVGVALDASMDSGVVDAGSAPASESTRYATRIVPDPPNAWIRAQGLSRGVVRVTAEVRPGSRIKLGLSRACLGVRCPLGQTCVSGLCESVPVGGECP